MSQCVQIIAEHLTCRHLVPVLQRFSKRIGVTRDGGGKSWLPGPSSSCTKLSWLLPSGEISGHPQVQGTLFFAP